MIKFYKILLSVFFLGMCFSGFSQELTITGKVTGENGEPLPGANVLVKGTTVGTVTDVDGNYSLGVSMRTHQYRLTEWRHRNTGEVEYELYDHVADPDENHNVANVSVYDSVKMRLINQLNQSREDGMMAESQSD